MLEVCAEEIVAKTKKKRKTEAERKTKMLVRASGGSKSGRWDGIETIGLRE